MLGCAQALSTYLPYVVQLGRNSRQLPDIRLLHSRDDPCERRLACPRVAPEDGAPELALFDERAEDRALAKDSVLA